MGIIILLGLYFVLYDFHNSFFAYNEDHYHVCLELKDVPYSEEPFVYYSEDDSDFAKLNAIKGNRIQYSMAPDVSNPHMYMNSMAMGFLPKGYKEIQR